jgi:hypothetical protein
LLAALGYKIKGTVEDMLGGALFAAHHQNVNKLCNQRVTKLRVRQGLTLLGHTPSCHE